MARMLNNIMLVSQNAPQFRKKLGTKRIVAGAKYELWDKFAPDNEVIWFVGASGSTNQRLNITDGYEH